jgi:YfiH family protein
MSIDVTMDLEQRGELVVHRVAIPAEYGVEAFVTNRSGGVSDPPYDSLNLGEHVGDDAQHVIENRRRVAAAIGVSPSHLRIVRQVHGTTVVLSSLAATPYEGDAIVSDDDSALAILVADCIPLLLIERATSRFALVHAGWRGLRGGIIAAALAHFSDPSNVYAFLGPSISRDKYQIGSEVAAHFAHVTDALEPDGDDHFRLDLRLVATTQLLHGGVTDGAIVRSREVTDNGILFFSDRAQRPCGRFALVARRAS